MSTMWTSSSLTILSVHINFTWTNYVCFIWRRGGGLKYTQSRFFNLGIKIVMVHMVATCMSNILTSCFKALLSSRPRNYLRIWSVSSNSITFWLQNQHILIQFCNSNMTLLTCRPMYDRARNLPKLYVCFIWVSRAKWAIFNVSIVHCMPSKLTTYFELVLSITTSNLLAFK